MEQHEGCQSGLRVISIPHQAWMPKESPAAVHGLSPLSGRYRGALAFLF